MTALLTASLLGKVELVSYLAVDRRARTDRRALYGFTALHLAALGGHFAVINLLYTVAGADANALDAFAKTPYFWAWKHGHVQCRKLLSNPEARRIPRIRGNSSTAPVPHAGPQAKPSTGPAGRSMAEACGKPERKEPRLASAVAGGPTQSAETASVATIQGPSLQHKTRLLHKAAKAGQLDVVRSLVTKYKLNVDAPGKAMQTALHLAAQGGHNAVVMYLVKTAKANVGAADVSGRTPLHLAAEEGLAESLRILCHHTTVEAKERNGETALNIAVRRGWLVTTLALLRDGNADPRARAREDSPPLLVAMLSGCEDIAHALLQAIAEKPEAGDDSLMTHTFEMFPRRNEHAGRLDGGDHPIHLGDIFFYYLEHTVDEGLCRSILQRFASSRDRHQDSPFRKVRGPYLLRP